MLRKYIRRYSNRFLSKWVVLAFDSGLTLVMFVVATLVRFNFDYSKIEPGDLELQAFFVTLVYVFTYLISQSYTGIIRHTSLNDAFRILTACFFAFFGLVVLATAYTLIGHQSPFNVARSVLIIHYLLTVFFLLGSRFMVKSIFQQAQRTQQINKTRVLIFGAGASGLLTKNALMQDRQKMYSVVGFLDDNIHKTSKSLEGIPVYLTDRVLNDEFIEKTGVREMIISVQKISLRRRKELTERALELGLTVKVVPKLESWINGEFSSRQIRTLKIEELLERDPIQLSSKNVRRYLKGKSILVTGAAGSIGSEIVRQILHFQPGRVVLLDQAESPLYDLEFELRNGEMKHMIDRVDLVVGNIKDLLRMEKVFKTYKPEVVFHAAAYKHVPLMEMNPYEAILVNVFGTKIISDLSVEYGVERFVMVSTDKAVNPTNVMGASKRVAECYVQSLSTVSNTQFITTRFGNVLGSNGSVIPIFRKQIENGGPLTITHPDIVRYFMTIPEACNLVLEAGSMGRGGEIYVFDMGEAVRIYDLAKKMITLSGLEIGRDIDIKITGLRPGEKLYEELLNSEENTLPTHHPKIQKAKVREIEYEMIRRMLDELSEELVNPDNFRLVAKVKEIVPEFISNNSIYSTLDRKRTFND
ncbi:MAG: polysaccharide biosynthesis protein [Bacteroidota bacterium]|nr:polysaccharide biosynthesis protein [Bacteroidota bacterium]MDX5427219.1 polysaccharide biosynthesis protein [Bacteroidota bacterium]